MKKKIIAGLAALTCLIGALAISSPSVYASEVPNEGISVVNEEASTDYFRTVPQELIDQGEFDYGGLHYVVSSSTTFTPSAVTNPADVKELIVYHSFNRSAINYSGVDWSGYTNLENVIIAATNVNYAQDILAVLPSGENLYVGGGCNFEEALETMPFKNIYLYSLYTSSMNNFTSSSFTNYLSSSSIENIYYNDFIGEQSASNITSFNSANHTNKNGETLQMTAFNDWTYPEHVFYPFAGWDPTPILFESEGRWFCPSSSVTTAMSGLTFTATSINEKVVDLDASNIKNGNSLDNSHTYGKIYMPKNEDYNFSGVRAEELIIRPYSSMSLNFNYLSRIKTVRFVNSSATLKIDSGTTISESSQIEKIYIPNESKDSFTALTENEAFAPYIEYYDFEDYVAPTNSYLSDDGNVYGVANYKYSIEQMETAKETLTTIGLEVPANTVIDEMMEFYELPIEDYSSLDPVYTVRNFDTIVLPKNMDATKVLEAFEFLIALNHGQMCDSEGATIVADTTNYTLGYNAVLPITITLPDATTVTKDVTVRVMATEDNKAYILDGNDVYIITNLTEEIKTLSSLMAPFMEYHLMESQVEYNESPILNSTSYGYLAGNSYTASLSSGKAKVVVSDVELIETEDTPAETPDTGDTETPDVNEDSNVVFKEITTIYTPETVDGSRLMSVMRDFLCTVNGEAYNDYGFAIGTNSGRTNKEDYSFSAWTKIGDFEYDERINVKIINFQFDMGFVVFADGDIAVIFNSNKDYDNNQIETGIKSFLTSQSLNAESVVMPEDEIDLTNTYTATYDGGDIYIVNSGVNVDFSSSTQAVDQSSLKQGFVALERVIYTKGYTTEDAMRALGKNILLKDGKLYAEDYTIEYTTKENSKYVDVVFKKGETVLLTKSFYFEEVESEYDYIFARAFHFDYGYLVMDKQGKAPEYDINDVMLDIVPRFRGLLTPFATEAVVDFTKKGTTDIDGVYQVGNGSYYEYEFNVEVCNLDSAIRTNEVVVDGNGPVGELIADKFNDAFEDFKTRFEENKAFKAAAIALGTITAILLVWGIWAIFKKIFKWLRK